MAIWISEYIQGRASEVFRDAGWVSTPGIPLGRALGESTALADWQSRADWNLGNTSWEGLEGEVGTAAVSLGAKDDEAFGDL